MYPALSVILFSSLSGAGYGLMFLIGLLAPAGALPDAPAFAWSALALALGLVSAGLFVSALHLHHPERAWRALSQWRSSWLSREGVAAVVGYVPALAFGWLWLSGPRPGPWLALAGLATAALAAVTVWCTANIYASLKPIRQWHQPLVPILFMVFALGSGALWLLALLGLFGAVSPLMLAGVIGTVVLAWGLKWRYWRTVDRDRPISTAASAIGVGGTVKVLDPPHTEDNYLLSEMGFRVARKHALKLRRIALLLGLGLPVVLVGTGAAIGAPGAAALVGAAAISGLAGIVIERWLFFAEATHTVALYYGR